MAVVIDKNVSIITATTSKVKSVTISFGGKKYLEALEECGFKDCLVAIITFHSLEDRIVKERFKKWANSCICLPGVYRCECGNNHELGEILTKKPLTASQSELAQNSRSKSAKLRVFKIKG